MNERVTEWQLSDHVRRALAWGPRTPDELLDFAYTSGAPAAVTESLQELPRRRYRRPAEVWRNVPEARRSA